MNDFNQMNTKKAGFVLTFFYFFHGLSFCKTQDHQFFYLYNLILMDN